MIAIDLVRAASPIGLSFGLALSGPRVAPLVC